ncbi:nuclear GTPase SLIP-GC-like [Chanos chanos]|uniref:Nuclear GTPase SLIP-GC-like n=1 Tax=Chanos chanos TaxID=29144 RepID=A0A6J2WYF6_CHACN|nr:nuclear GTPase SLIP-GC-like [Chanos chanos]
MAECAECTVGKSGDADAWPSLTCADDSVIVSRLQDNEITHGQVIDDFVKWYEEFYLQLNILRIVLLEKNVLENNRVAFETESPPVSVDHHTERARGQVEGRPITTINTPDLFHPQLSHHQLSVAVEECVYLSDPGPHAFILELQPDNFTEESRKNSCYLSSVFTYDCVTKHRDNYIIKFTDGLISNSDGGTYQRESLEQCVVSLALSTETGVLLMVQGRMVASGQGKGGPWDGDSRGASRSGLLLPGALLPPGWEEQPQWWLRRPDNILGLDEQTVRKTTVGVFGMTGDGKSSLINAILGKKFLLPSGTGGACTSVCVQVETNMTDVRYTAEIEFISKKEWEADLKDLLAVLREEEEEPEESDIVQTAKEKISAVFGEEAVQRSFEELKHDDQYSRIVELLTSPSKRVSCRSASKLSDEIRCFIKNDDSNLGGCYWPLVKRVTVKVPDCGDILENITLVDIPGNGDYSKTRDQMWTKILRNCSIVWIVCDIDRATSKKEAWEILNRSLTDMAQGGECTTINFICTKTDNIDTNLYMRNSKLEDGDLKITNKDQRKRACTLHRNRVSKDKVKKTFEKQGKFMVYCPIQDEQIFVFTVSSQEYFEEDSILKQEDTEILELQDLLRTLNRSHSRRVATQYLSRASGLLSLIHASNCNHTERKLCCELESRLTEGAEKAENQSVKMVQKNVNPPRGTDGRRYHKTLTALCKNKGCFRSRNGETRDLNKSLAAAMYDCINEKFHLFFPNEEKTGQSVREKIDEFSIISSPVIMEYKHSPVMGHILNFLRTEENKLKEDLQRDLLEEKKKLYASLTDVIKEKMIVCYKEAAEHTGTGSMKRKQDVLQNHVESEKHSMFKDAKKIMLDSLNKLTEHIERELAEKLQESMAHSLTEWNTISNIDVTEEIEEMKELSRMLDEDQT